MAWGRGHRRPQGVSEGQGKPLLALFEGRLAGSGCFLALALSNQVSLPPPPTSRSSTGLWQVGPVGVQGPSSPPQSSGLCNVGRPLGLALFAKGLCRKRAWHLQGSAYLGLALPKLAMPVLLIAKK